MAGSTPLADVKEARIAGKTLAFAPSLAWLGNYVARNPYPWKFVYTSCPHVCASGLPCSKSLEFGNRCGHSLVGEPKFRFQVILFDAAFAGSKPLRALIWDHASIILNTGPVTFSVLDEATQLSAVQAAFQKCRKVQVSLVVKGLELHINRLAFVDTDSIVPSGIVVGDSNLSSPAQNTPTRVVKVSTPTAPKSTKKILDYIIEALKVADLDE